MSHESDCIFCTIVAGEIPSFKLYEDDATLAFMDINPFNPGHCLVIPKAHHPDLFAMTEAAFGAVGGTAVKVARAVRQVCEPDGMNLVQANGPAAGQTVYHFHLHIFPRANDDGAEMNWGFNPGDMDAIGALAEKIRAAIVD